MDRQASYESVISPIAPDGNLDGDMDREEQWKRAGAAAAERRSDGGRRGDIGVAQ